MLIFISNMIARLIYFDGFSKSQTTSKRLFAPVKYKGYNWESLLSFLPRESKAFAVREIRTFSGIRRSGPIISDNCFNWNLSL